MVDEKTNWKRFQRLRFDSKTFTKRAKRAETTTTRHAHKFVLSKLDSLRSVKQHVIVWLILVGGLIGGVALQMYWYQDSYKTTAWKAGGTYAEAVQGPITTLNPLYATTIAEQSASKLIFSSLFDYDSSGKLSDDLATSMTVSPDGKQYTISLRDDVRWSDNAKLTAEDVEFTVELMKSPEVRSVMYYDRSWADVTAEALDDTTVRFTLPARYAAFPHALTFAVLPIHTLSEIPGGAIRQNAFSIAPVGSGPFYVRFMKPSPDRGHKIVYLASSENYYEGAPRLSRFELHAYEDQDDMLRALQIGEVNAAAGIDLKRGDLPASFSVKQYPTGSGVYALLNSESVVLKDRKVRKALQVGTNTDQVRQATGYSVSPLHLPFVEGQLSGQIPKPPQYNTALAKKLLNEAGWRLKKGSPTRQRNGQNLQLNVVTVKDATYEKVLERLAGQWRELGIEVNTEVRDKTQDFVGQTLQPRSYDVLLNELVIGADPDVFAYWHSSQASRLGRNYANYRNDIADDALSSARGRSDASLRNAKYITFSEQWLKDAPAIGLYQSAMQYAYRNSVQPEISTTLVPTESDRFTDVIYWAAERREVYKTP